MFTTFGQYIGGKVITAVLVVSGAAAVIWFWRHPEQLAALWQTMKYVAAWIGFVLILPWAAWFVTRWVVSLESNGAAYALLAGLTLADALVAICLIGGVSGLGMLSWIVLILGFLVALVYNLMVCEYQAGRLEEN